jgi:hypothetical protein
MRMKMGRKSIQTWFRSRMIKWARSRGVVMKVTKRGRGEGRRRGGIETDMMTEVQEERGAGAEREDIEIEEAAMGVGVGVQEWKREGGAEAPELTRGEEMIDLGRG